MICENCGAEIRNRENYCPNCGMEIISPHNKSIKARYMAGEYTENQGNYNPRKQKSRREKERYVEDSGPEVFEEPEPVETDERYETEEYEEPGGVSVLTVIILFLIVALLIGFVIGILVFSGFLHSLPGFSNLK